jgi:O-antigen ligase
LLRAGLWTALAVTPAIFASPIYDDFTLAKQASLFFAASLVLLGLALEGDIMPRDRWIRVLVSAWIAWTTLTFVAGIDPRGGLLGLYQYRQGFLTQLVYVVLFLGALSVARRNGSGWFLVPGLVGMAIVTGYTAIQAAGLDPVDWWLDTSERAIGTVGNANELAAYATIGVAFAGALATRSRWGTAAAVGVAAAAWFVVLEAESRSGLGALVVGHLTILGAGVVLRLGMRPVARMTLLLGAGAVVGILLSAWAGSAAATTKRVQSGIEATDAGGSTRISLVRGTLPTIAASPLVGYGPDGLYLAFPQHRPADLKGAFETYDLVVQSSHNWFLDTAANTGVPGLALLLTLLGTVAWKSVRHEWVLRDAAIAPVWGAMAAYCAIVMLNPLSLAPHATFFVLLGMLAGRAEPLVAPVRTTRFATLRLPYRLLMVAPSSVALFLLAAVMPVADLFADRGWDAYAAKDFARSSEQYGRAASWLPIERDYAGRHADALLTLGAVQGLQGDSASKGTLLEAEESLRKLDSDFGADASEARALATVMIGLKRPQVAIEAAIDRVLELNPHGHAEALYAEILRAAAARGDGKLGYDDIDHWVYVDRLPIVR